MNQLQDNIIASAYTRMEAQDICDAYQYLEKQPYKENGITLGMVDCVAVAPFDNLNKWLFLHEYVDCKHPQKALAFYMPPYFDVLIILLMANGNLSFQDIDTYVYNLDKKFILPSQKPVNFKAA